MKLSEAKEAYYEFTGISSNVNRQIGFAGIAIIWLFCQFDQGRVNIPNELYYPTILIIISLGLDLLQYISASIVWGSFHRYYEKRDKSEECEVEASRFLTYPQSICYVGKIISMVIAYVSLLIFLINHIEII